MITTDIQEPGFCTILYATPFRLNFVPSRLTTILLVFTKLRNFYLSVLQAWLLHEQNNLVDLIDPQLHLNDEELWDVQRVINVCLLCIQNSAEKRPTMAKIVSILQSDTESEIQVLGEGAEPTYKSGKSRTKSLDYKSNGLESVSEEGGTSSNGTNGYHKQSQPPGNPGDFSIDVELSEIRAR
jgi:hypothetical protein